MKRPLIIIGVIMALSTIYIFSTQDLSQSVPDQAAQDSQSEEVHYHAAFRLFVDEEQIDFTDFKYMSVKPCSENEDHPHDFTNLRDFIHLHDSVGDVIHIHGPQATWAMVFASLDYKLPAGLLAYNEGKSVEGALESIVQPYESMTFFSEGTSQAFIDEIHAQPITREYIETIESKSEGCGTT